MVRGCAKNGRIRLPARWGGAPRRFISRPLNLQFRDSASVRATTAASETLRAVTASHTPDIANQNAFMVVMALYTPSPRATPEKRDATANSDVFHQVHASICFVVTDKH